MKTKKYILAIILFTSIFTIKQTNASTLTGSWAGPKIEWVENVTLSQTYGYNNGFQRYLLTTNSASAFKPAQIQVYPVGLYEQKKPVTIPTNTNMIRFQASAGYNATTNESALAASTGLNASIRLTSNDSIVCYPYTSGSTTTFECPIADSMQGKTIQYILFQFIPSKLGSYQFSVSDVFQLFNEDISKIYNNTNTIKNDTTTIKNNTTTIKDNTNTIKSDIGTIKNNTNEIKNKMNQDISTNDKEAPNTTNYESSKTQEQNIKNSISNANPSDITFSTDTTATSKIWEITTNFLNTNSKVMGLMISVLSLGVIKMILNR